MQYVTLGRTGLKVSRLCLGTMNFGGQATEADSFPIMDKALELGFNFFDTADVYGGKLGVGATEAIVGRWLAQGGRRDKIVLATKCYNEMGPGPNQKGLSAYNIRRCCDASLKRLQTDHLDLYQMHHVDRSVSWEEIYLAMERLVAEGKITYLGTSNFAGWHIARGQQIASARNFLGLVSEQSIYNLVNRTVELEVLPACQFYGMAVIPWSPLNGGLLGGVLEPRADGRRSRPGTLKQVEKYRPQLEKWEPLCRDLGHAPADVAHAWLLHQPAVTAPIIGPRTMDQLTGAVKCLDIKLDADTLKKLDEIWPGPGGAAPEAYAW